MGTTGKMQESSRQTTEIPQWVTDKWNEFMGMAGGEAFKPTTPFPTDQILDAYKQWVQGGLDLRGNMPDFGTLKNLLMDESSWVQANRRDPNEVNFQYGYGPERYSTGQFGVPDVKWTDTLAGYKPDYERVSGTTVATPQCQAQSYEFNPERVSAERVNAPQRGSIRDVSGPTNKLEPYLLASPERINIPQLEKYQMVQPRDVT